MTRSKIGASARVQAAVDEQEKRMNESWFGKIIPNDYEEYRKLVDPRPEEIANAFKLDVLGRTVTSLYVAFFARLYFPNNISFHQGSLSRHGGLFLLGRTRATRTRTLTK